MFEDNALVRRVQAHALPLTRALDGMGPLLARLTVGWVFVGTGWGKLHHLDEVTAFFTELGLPVPHAQAVLVGTTELVGGALVLVGLFTRLASLPLEVARSSPRTTTPNLPAPKASIMQVYKLLLASLVLVCACDKAPDTMQSPATSTSAMAPTMAPSGMAMAPSTAMTGSMAMGGDSGATMAPTMGAMTAPAGSAPMMNDKPKMAPKMSPSANHM